MFFVLFVLCFGFLSDGKETCCSGFLRIVGFLYVIVPKGFPGFVFLSE